MLSKTLKAYSDTNPEKFNEDLICMKYDDDVLSCINDIFKALEIIDGVKFLGSSMHTDESEFPPIIKTVDGEDIEVIHAYESRLNMIKFKFELTGIERDRKTNVENVKTDVVEKYLFYPKTMPGYKFLLNNSYHYPIYQIVDSATYKHADSLTLKTLLMGITLKDEKSIIEDYYGNKHRAQILKIFLFKQQINYLYYFMAYFGHDEAMKFLKAYDDIEIIKADKKSMDPDNYYYFKINRNWNIRVTKQIMEENPDLVHCYVHMIALDSNRRVDSIQDKSYWIMQLGAFFSRPINKRKDKAEGILLSFRRILDNRTRDILPLDIENKDTIYHLVRWMAFNYDRLKSRNNMDLKYKRIRVVEYLLYSLLHRFSNITYRILNTDKPTLRNKHDLFSSLDPMFIVKSIGSNELLRYINSVNGVDLFSSVLRYSFRGDQGLGSNNATVNIAYRGIDPSYMGRIGQTTASASDPGMSGSFTPFMEVYPDMFFSPDSLD